MYRFVFICFLLIFGSCGSGNYIRYHRRVAEAQFCFYAHDYKKAAKYYGKAFSGVSTPWSDDIPFYATSLWESGEQSVALKWLDSLPTPDIGNILQNFGYFVDMDSAIKAAIIHKNLQYWKIVDSLYEHNTLLQKMEVIFEKDQAIRKKYIQFNRDYPKDSIGLKRIDIEKKETDARVMLEIEAMIAEHGFLGGPYFTLHPRKMGHLLIHQGDWLLSHKKQLKRYIRQGRLYPADYAKVYDKYSMDKAKPVAKYGQFMNTIEGKSAKKVYRNCRKIGVSPYYVQVTGLPLKRGLKPNKTYYYDQQTKRKNSTDHK